MSKSQFEIKIDWIDELEGYPVVTYAGFSVLISGNVIWPTENVDPNKPRFEWFSDQFLSHLSKFWGKLILRQGYPFDLAPPQPSKIWNTAKARWSKLAESIVDDEEEKLIAYERIHNIANAFGGIFDKQPLWLVRENNDYLIDVGKEFYRLPYHVVMQELVRCGNTIRDRLRKDPKNWEVLLKSWESRDKGDRLTLLRLATNLTDEKARALLDSNLLEANDNVIDMAKENELRVAARMAGALEATDIAKILMCIKKTERGATNTLDNYSKHIRANRNSFGNKFIGVNYPYKQGVRAAERLRDLLNIDPFEPADPFKVLALSGVEVLFEPLPRTVDAIACWGKKHGPAVILNGEAQRLEGQRVSSQSWAIRVTAAHELCHLLLDRDHMLSAVEVLNGRMPLRVEQRARAFAAAFLLPGTAAQWAWDEAGQPEDKAGLDLLLKQLCKRFGVTRMVAAWKLEHGLGPDGSRIGPVLDHMIPARKAEPVL